MEVILYKSTRLLVPVEMQQAMLKRLHSPAHVGTTKMRKLAQELVYWAGLNADIATFVDGCDTCKAMLPSRPTEPMIVHTAEYPMKKLGAIFSLGPGKTFS